VNDVDYTRIFAVALHDWSAWVAWARFGEGMSRSRDTWVRVLHRTHRLPPIRNADRRNAGRLHVPAPSDWRRITTLVLTTYPMGA